MKNAIVLSIAWLAACAAALAADDLMVKRVSANYQDTPLTEALEQVAESAGLRILLDEKLAAGAKPVTLKAENIPANQLLRRLLAPNGLDAVTTKDGALEVVPAESDVGMAKAIGRALRTFARLGRKLEKAVAEGDEVRVPGWTEADDGEAVHALMEWRERRAYLYDMCRWAISDPEDLGGITRLLRAADPDVRAGALVGATVRGTLLRRSARKLPEPAGALLHDAMTQTAEDPDPIVRACAVTLSAAEFWFDDGRYAAARAEILNKGAKDAAVEVRFAAALACLHWRRVKEEDASSWSRVLETLSKDSSAAVRLAAGRSAISRLTHASACASHPASVTKAYSSATSGHLRPNCAGASIPTELLSLPGRGTSRADPQAPSMPKASPKPPSIRPTCSTASHRNLSANACAADGIPVSAWC